MSMEVYALSERRLTSIQEWQRTLDVMGFAMRLSTTTPFADLRGALPVKLEHTASHFECDHWDVADIVRTYPDIHFEQRWKYALAFRWGGDFDSAFSAYVAAAAYGRAVGGVIFDCQEGAMISSQRAIEIAHELKDGRPKIEAAVRAAVSDVVKRLKRRE
jgi:hypothetical protein